MLDIFAPLTPADYAFVVGLIESDVNFTDDAGLRRRLARYEEEGSADARVALDRQLEHEIRYLGSAEIAYLFRFLSGQAPGVSFREIIRDVARPLRVRIDTTLGTDREQLEHLVQEYVTGQFARLPRDEQQQMLVDLGVEQEKAADFIKKSAGVFAIPALIQAFGTIVVDGLIKNVIFGTIARLIGKQLAGRLFRLVAGRFPWWLRWVGPVAWTVSIGWTVLDLQGPAQRKTIPIVLYLGLCALRDPSTPATT